MDGPFIRLVLCISVLSLAVACFLLGTIALVVPHWATYRFRDRDERGNFGPWTVCKNMGYGKSSCGAYVSNFKPIFGAYAGGICSAIAVTAIGVLALASALQLLSQCHRSSILMSQFTLASIKLVNGVVGALLTLVGVSLFAMQPDDLDRGIIIEWSICFYLEVILATFSLVLLLLALLEFLIARRLPPGGMDAFVGRKSQNHHPTIRKGLAGTTISNPGYREEQQLRLTTNGISMTDSSVRFVLSPTTVPNPTLTRLEFARELSKRASQKRSPSQRKKRSPKGTTSPPQRSSNESHTNNSNNEWNNGSVRSHSPTSNGSTVSSLSTLSTMASLSSNPRGPLRSSLKKSRTVDDGFGIQNPGFSGTSPTLSRTGSLKKVRIQTQSTDV